MNNMDTINMVISDLEERIKSTDKLIELNKATLKSVINEKNYFLEKRPEDTKEIEDIDKLIASSESMIAMHTKHKEGYLKDLEEWKKLKEEQENG